MFKRIESVNLVRMRALLMLCVLALSFSGVTGGISYREVHGAEAMPPGSLAELADREELKEAVAFVVGEPLALAKGTIALIDSDDRTAVPWVDAQTARAYAPLRFVASALQAEVDWDQETREIVLVHKEQRVNMRVGDTSMDLNGSVVRMDAAPELKGSRVYLPLRALADALGLEIHYQDGLIIMQEANALQNLRDNFVDTLSLLALKLKPLASVNSYENLALLLEHSYGSGINYVTTTLDGAVMVEAEISSGDARAMAPMAPAPTDAPMSSAPGNGASEESNADFSTTNTQVEGIDEADVVKTDGTYLYLVHQDQAVIVKALPADAMEITARISFDDIIDPLELYIEEDRLVIIGEKHREMPLFDPPSDLEPRVDNEGARSSAMISPYDYYHNRSMVMTQMLVFDISDRSQPQLQRTVEVEGRYVSSRRIESSYYLVANKNLNWYSIRNGYEAPQPYFADTLVSDELLVMPYERIYCFPEFQSSNYMMVAAFDASKSEPADIQSYLGAGETLYVSSQNLYVAINQYQYQQVMPASIDDRAEAAIAPSFSWEYVTRVFRFALSEGKLEYHAAGEVPGTLLNQFSMDEHQGYLRLATTSSARWTPQGSEEMQNQLYVMNNQMNIVGRIENIAPGERIYSARFMGDRAFMVTFRTVDPLFVIDLKEPTAPRILGELKIPGYSDYLHPLSEDYLIGFGKDAIAIPYKDAQGRVLGESAYYLGMKLSLFDVSDLENPKETAMIVIGDRGTESSLLRNHKALLFNAQTRLLAFPVLECRVLNGELMQGSYPRYGEAVFDGLLVYEVDQALGAEAFTELGRITQQSNSVDPARGLNVDYQRSIERGLYIGDVIYTLSPSAVQANSLDDFSLVGSLLLTGN